MTLRTIVLVTAAFGATSSFAAQTSQSSTSSSGTVVVKSLDPNEVVCERQEVLGSRLQSKRICMTRSEWAEQKSQDRQNIERVQMQRGSSAPK